jgi:serine/threonine-protein phosphatase 6 regulatory ankyrin repeat subunit B
MEFIEEVENGNLENVKFGADVNLQNKYGYTALIKASGNGYTNVVKELLLNNNLNVDFQDKDGNTALMTASFYGRTNVVKELLNNKADINLQNKDGNTAYDFAKTDELKNC